MKNLSFRRSILSVAVVMGLASLPLQAGAATMYMTFASTGGNASGTLNGDSFSNATWQMEYQIDTSVVDSNTGTEMGSYTGAITGGTFVLNGTSYTLAGDSATGNVHMTSYSTAYDSVSINPTSGGYLQFVTGFGTTHPALFNDVNDLSSGNMGATVFDTSTDAYNNQSIINYQTYLDWYTNEEVGGIFTGTGDVISIYENSGAASGKFSVSLSDTSNLSAVPVPAAAWLFASGLIGLAGVARRKISQ